MSSSELNDVSSELSDMFQNYLSLVSVINGGMGNGKRNPRIFADSKRWLNRSFRAPIFG